ncbi:MAG: OsmC family protein [Chitinophagaceae bacterium]|nr:OsmC family protein [Chitinophagaceae bacterium]
MVKIQLERVNEFSAFDAKDQDGHIVKIDTKPDMGGQNYGVRPMQLLLMGLGGCSAIDIISILKKQRQEVKGFKIDIEADRQQGVDPSLWTDITVVFKLEGDIDQDKAEKACSLSIDKYCSVAATLTKSGSNIKWKVLINK